MMNIEIQVERWPINRLKPYPGNARTHSDAQIRQIAASITEFGWTNFGAEKKRHLRVAENGGLKDAFYCYAVHPSDYGVGGKFPGAGWCQDREHASVETAGDRISSSM